MPAKDRFFLLLLVVLSLTVQPKMAHSLTFSGSAQLGEAGSGRRSNPASLTISGRIEGGKPITLSTTEFKSLSEVVASCRCPWLGGDHVYRGAPLLPLLESLGMEENAQGVELRGASRYRVGIRMEDLRQHRYLVVYEMDGILLAEHPEAARQGTLMTVVDFLPGVALDMELYKYQFVWQLSEIRVL